MRKSAVALATVAVAFLAACQAGSSSGNGTASPGTADASLAVGLTAEPASLDFTKNDGAAIPQALLYNVNETLVKVDQSGRVVPALAKSWDVSSDRTTYTFHLVQGAKFSDGKPFTADDAKFSIERVKSDWTISLKSAMDTVDTVSVTNPTTLVVKLRHPSNDWLYRMTTRIGAMFSRTGVGNLATKPIGTGPYLFSKWVRGDSITLTRNDRYWGHEPYFKTIALKYFKDPTAENNALLSGTIDVNGAVQSPDSLGQFENNPKYQVIEGTTNGEVVLSFNNGSGPLKNRKLRQAVKYGIDHKALLDTCWAGKGKLIGGMVPPTDPWYEDLTGLYPHDPAKARQLLKESGEAGRTLRLRLPTLPYATACGQVVKSQLDQLGFKVKIDQLEFPAAWLSTVFTNADYDMSIVAHVEPRDMPAVFGDPKYYTRYGKPALRTLLQKADEGTPDQQVTYMKQAARMLAEDAAADWLFVLPNLIVADKDVTGLPKNAISESFDLTQLGRR
ncbi:MAG: ABC transporter substrate-binding protein [Streptosporangiales bacterium]|nr:ABC transporter substrate-binding protein [Streptosporangiales bacterium]MBO0889790.1 ABC transporter substrate-binding protein [Acidothermales bacterium]